jgi:hypothetical protein
MLNAATMGSQASLCHTQERHDLIKTLLSEIGQIYPQVSYELDLGSPTANAQALARGSVRVVRLYGGLALHPMIGQDTLIFVLLHETGHHFAAGPRFALDPMLACDCAADDWALTTGASSWLGHFKRSFDVRKVVEGMEAVILSTCGEFRSRNKHFTRDARTQCWTASWQARKSILCPKAARRTGKLCCI